MVSGPAFCVFLENVYTCVVGFHYISFPLLLLFYKTDSFVPNILPKHSNLQIQYSEFLKAIQSQAEKVHFILGSGISGDEEEEKGKDLKDSLKEATKGD